MLCLNGQKMRQLDHGKEGPGKSSGPGHGHGSGLSPEVSRAVKGKLATRHTKRPPSERRFKCEQCERMFFTRKDVKRHMVVHTGVRNFACPFCQQRFGRKDHLVRHAKKSHNRDTRSSAHFPGPGSGGGGTCSGRRGPLPAHGSHVTQASTHPGSAHPHAAHPPHLPLHHHLQVLPNTSSGHDSISNRSPPCYGNTSEQHTLFLLGPSSSHPNNGGNSYPNTSIGTISSMAESHFGSPGPGPGPGLHPNEEMAAPGSLPLMKPITSCDSGLLTNGPHYFSFPIPGPGPGPSFMGPTYLPTCFVPNGAGPSGCAPNGMSSNNGMSIPVCGDHRDAAAAAAAAAFSLDVNSSLPHFNQIFQ